MLESAVICCGQRQSARSGRGRVRVAGGEWRSRVLFVFAGGVVLAYLHFGSFPAGRTDRPSSWSVWRWLPRRHRNWQLFGEFGVVDVSWISKKMFAIDAFSSSRPSLSTLQQAKIQWGANRQGWVEVHGPKPLQHRGTLPFINGQPSVRFLHHHRAGPTFFILQDQSIHLLSTDTPFSTAGPNPGPIEQNRGL